MSLKDKNLVSENLFHHLLLENFVIKYKKILLTLGHSPILSYVPLHLCNY